MKLRHIESLVCSAIDGHLPIEEAAAAVVAYQRDHIPALRAFWDRRGFTETSPPLTAPGVPTDVFKHATLVSDEAPPSITFRTSGTTVGARGQSPRISTVCYDHGAIHAFNQLPLPNAPAFPALTFPTTTHPDSSLSHMVATLATHHRTTPAFCLSPKGIDHPTLRTHATPERPTVLFGTAFALVHLLDSAPLPLHPDSLLIETGGYKGQSRTLSKPDLYTALAQHTSLPITSIRSEYSMTELSSQLYSTPWDTTGPQHLTPPPWLVPTAVNPETLHPLPHGTPGLLRFFDLANVDTPCAIQTSDIGTVHRHTGTSSAPTLTVTLQGRHPDATPRGCSLAAEEVLQLGRFT